MSSRTDTAAEVQDETTSMACTIRIRVVGAEERIAASAISRAVQLFRRVDRACSRFDRSSPLMRANAQPQRWHVVPRVCYVAIVAAYDAYRRTGGRFDPRVHDDLVRLGYEKSMTVAVPAPRADALRGRDPLPPWRPEFRPSTSEVRLGEHPVDLGGIAKGLTVSWASKSLRGAGAGHLVDAGGDCQCSGTAPDGGAWRVGVENPFGQDHPVAVLVLQDAAAATSSVRVRNWQANGVPVHHLIDPVTGLSGGMGLSSVTVVDAEAGAAEVWSKTLFLVGGDDIAQLAMDRDVAAFWVHDDGRLGWSAHLEPVLAWVAG